MREEDQLGLAFGVWQGIWTGEQWGGGFQSGTSTSTRITVIQRLGGMAASALVAPFRQLSSPACGRGA